MRTIEATETTLIVERYGWSFWEPRRLLAAGAPKRHFRLKVLHKCRFVDIEGFGLILNEGHMDCIPVYELLVGTVVELLWGSRNWSIAVV